VVDVGAREEDALACGLVAEMRRRVGGESELDRLVPAEQAVAVVRRGSTGGGHNCRWPGSCERAGERGLKGVRID
jgi:hypothetical protein